MAITRHFLDQKLKKMFGGHQGFSKSIINENAQSPLSIFWIQNHKKYLVVAKSFLDKKCLKMPNDRQMFFGQANFKNILQSLGIFQIKNHKLTSVFQIGNHRKYLVVAKRFLDQRKVGIPKNDYQLLGILLIPN